MIAAMPNRNTEKRVQDLAKFEIKRQPDDTTCGPTCLHAVYHFYGRDEALGTLTTEIPKTEGGGTLGVHLALDALRRGYKARILTWNLNVFDPTWFGHGKTVLVEKLRAREKVRREKKMRESCRAYIEFLEGGGELELADLDAGLLRRFLRRGVPILTGLSSTFLYREPREHDDGREDDVAGDPAGHFVVLTGYDPEDRAVIVSDPMHPNPLATSHTYKVSMNRLIGAIFLGVITYDANLVVVEPPEESGGTASKERNVEDDRRRQ
ncbi:MAG: C39 family peptidase [Planctomycetota bacterium]